MKETGYEGGVCRATDTDWDFRRHSVLMNLCGDVEVDEGGYDSTSVEHHARDQYFLEGIRVCAKNIETLC